MYIILFIIFLLIVILFLLIHKPTSQFVDNIIWKYLLNPHVIEQELKIVLMQKQTTTLQKKKQVEQK